MLRLALDMKLFDVVAESKGGELVVDHIAAEAGADPLLAGIPYGKESFKQADRLPMARVISVLAAMGISKQV